MQSIRHATMTTPAAAGAGLSHHLRWGSAGYALGLALLLPWIIWMTESDLAATAGRTPAAAEPVLVQKPRQVRSPAEDAAADRARRVGEARQLITAKSLARARDLLAPLAGAGDAEALFLTAQTYDPVQLAASGVTDVPADPDRARHLYGRALAAGFEPARARLDLLR